MSRIYFSLSSEALAGNKKRENLDPPPAVPLRSIQFPVSKHNKTLRKAFEPLSDDGRSPLPYNFRVEDFTETNEK